VSKQKQHPVSQARAQSSRNTQVIVTPLQSGVLSSPTGIVTSQSAFVVLLVLLDAIDRAKLKIRVFERDLREEIFAAEKASPAKETQDRCCHSNQSEKRNDIVSGLDRWQQRNCAATVGASKGVFGPHRSSNLL